MTRLGRRKACLVGSAYGYWALFVASWWLWLTSSQNEPWFDAFASVAEIVFFPLLLATFGLCRLAWGSLNLFDANVVGGLLVDVAFASLLVVSLFAILVLRWKTAERTRDEVTR
jgi:hypothetical protein